MFNFSDCDENSLPPRVVQESRREKGVATQMSSSSSKSIEKVEAVTSREKTGSKTATVGTSQKSGGAETRDGERRGGGSASASASVRRAQPRSPGRPRL